MTVKPAGAYSNHWALEG